MSFSSPRELCPRFSCNSALESEIFHSCFKDSFKNFIETTSQTAAALFHVPCWFREKTTLKEANVKLSEKQAVVQKQLSEAKTQIQSLQFQKTQAHTLAENLTTELHLAKKNMEIVCVFHVQYFNPISDSKDIVAFFVKQLTCESVSFSF